ncbi:MAG: hypothetical protein WC818_28405 [Pseudomonas sp.]|jgi:hypothetical protein|uniref:hypothetical protein n=1 Tax=Pseudomonas sp. TaxID=306 RepID=UPI00356637CB
MGEGAPIPSNEAERLKEVAKFCPAGRDSDEVFDKIAAMTSAYFNAPVTRTSIVDELCIIDTVTCAPTSELDRGMLNDFAERVMMRICNMRARNFVDQPSGLFNRLRFGETIRVNSACEIDAVDVITPKVLNDIVKAPGYICAQDLILTITSRLQNCYPIIACFIKSVRRDSASFSMNEPGPEQICERILHNFKISATESLQKV